MMPDLADDLFAYSFSRSHDDICSNGMPLSRVRRQLLPCCAPAMRYLHPSAYGLRGFVARGGLDHGSRPSISKHIPTQ